MSWSPWIWMYLNEQIPMVCLGCLENKYFSRHLIFTVGWFSTKPSGTVSFGVGCCCCYLEGTAVTRILPRKVVEYFVFSVSAGCRRRKELVLLQLL